MPEGVDSSKISVVSAVKVDKRKLMMVGDSDTIRDKKSPEEKKKNKLVVEGALKREEQCNVCCMAWGGMMSTALSLVLCAMQTSFALYKDTRISFSLTATVRHVGWIALPGALVGTTLHYFLCEAMWSKRRNSWGMAWVKAGILNTFVWGALIGSGTMGWRKAMRMTSWGSNLYHKYPIPDERLELRLILNPNLFWTGMTWTYWTFGVIVGQMGYLACAAVTSWQNKVHFMMSPVGPYARNCLPRWRREMIARDANFELPASG